MITPEQIGDILCERFGEAVTSVNVDTAHPYAVVAAGKWLDIARFLHDDERLRFNFLRSLSGIDRPDDGLLEAVYDLHSMVSGRNGDREALWRLNAEFAIRVAVPRDHPVLPSVALLWPTADWHEREAYDMFGMVFEGHPYTVTDRDGAHPRRILCPDDWEGYPLRKDYEFPKEYEGIPADVEAEPTCSNLPPLVRE